MLGSGIGGPPVGGRSGDSHAGTLGTADATLQARQATSTYYHEHIIPQAYHTTSTPYHEHAVPRAHHTMSTPKDHQSALCVWPRRFTTSGAMYSIVPQNE